MLSIYTFHDAATEAALVDPAAPVTSSVTSTRAQAFLDRNARGGAYQPDPTVLAPPTSPPRSLAPSPSAGAAVPWYKNWKIVAPLAIGGVAVIGVGIWLLKPR